MGMIKNRRVTRKRIESAKETLRGKYKCERCDNRCTFDTPEELQEHRQSRHGEFEANDYLRKASNAKGYFRKDTLKPIESYKNNENIIRSTMPIQHPKKGRTTIDIYYIWDPNWKEYRIFTDECKYGEMMEIVFSNQKQCFVIKDLDKYKPQKKEKKENHEVPKVSRSSF